MLDGFIMLGVLTGILGLMAGVRLLRKRLGLSAEVQRKMVHVATGSAALTFPWVFSSATPVLILLGVAAAIMLLMRQSKVAMHHMGAVLHDVQRNSYGEIYLVLSVGLLFIRSTDMPILYVLPLLVVTLSDTASALVGTKYGQARFAVEEGTKSLEGVVAFFVVTWLSAMIALLLMTDAARINVIVLSLLIAAFCALVEADSWKGLDNLFIPVGAHLLLARHLETPPLEMMLVGAVFVAAIFGMRAIAPVLNISTHAARAYTILIFLVLSVAGVHNAALPVLAIAAHMFARSVHPCKARHPDLNLLAAATGVALTWMVAGQTLGQNVINLYNYTFGVVALIFFGLALKGYWRFALLPLMGATGALWLWSISMNPEADVWNNPSLPLMLAGVVLPMTLVSVVPDWFDTYRHAKAFALAALIPIALYLNAGALP